METFKTSTHEFTILIDNKDIKDMKRIGSELVSHGYKLINELEHEENTILIYSKKLESQDKI